MTVTVTAEPTATVTQTAEPEADTSEPPVDLDDLQQAAMERVWSDSSEEEQTFMCLDAQDRGYDEVGKFLADVEGSLADAGLAADFLRTTCTALFASEDFCDPYALPETEDDICWFGDEELGTDAGGGSSEFEDTLEWTAWERTWSELSSADRSDWCESIDLFGMDYVLDAGEELDPLFDREVSRAFFESKCGS
ncbi:hypothetical protein [Ornithinimicrobium sediminis]|uniref:hypothetical protein n=1 Tax=Ornithinimicrobium sediminis TaxID=2904603 RepID=UPI001E5AF263|nr:hypothetical protein [Ornithinimicrobium sediminis]MCE0486376.1 hypothetical protein [Ornithinimicrobium sediminis]